MAQGPLANSYFIRLSVAKQNKQISVHSKGKKMKFPYYRYSLVKEEIIPTAYKHELVNSRCASDTLKSCVGMKHCIL